MRNKFLTFPFPKSVDASFLIARDGLFFVNSPRNIFHRLFSRRERKRNQCRPGMLTRPGKSEADVEARCYEAKRKLWGRGWDQGQRCSI